MFSSEYALLALLGCSGGRGEAEGDSGVNRVRKWTNNQNRAARRALSGQGNLSGDHRT